MPKNKFQEVIFTILMVFVMVYAMVCYNIALNTGGMSNAVFLAAFRELPIMMPIAFILDFFLVGNLAKKAAFRMVDVKTERPFHLILAISAVPVAWMCPLMSLAATILFKHAGNQFIAVWLQTCAFNFPMALCWRDQLYVSCSARSSWRSRKREICRKHLNNVFYWGIFRISIYLPNNFCPFFKIVWGEYWYMCILYPIGSNFQTCDWGIS